MARETAVPEGSGFAFEMSLRALDEQLRRIEALDSKAGILIAADGILAGLLLSGRGPLLQAPKPVLFAAVAAVISSLSFALLAFIRVLGGYFLHGILSGSIRVE